MPKKWKEVRICQKCEIRQAFYGCHNCKQWLCSICYNGHKCAFKLIAKGRF